MRGLSSLQTNFYNFVLRTELICGISGQDGAYLAELLLKAGYTVCGTSRDAQMSSFSNLKRLGIKHLCLIFGITPTVCSKVINKMLELVVQNLRRHPLARVQFPT